MELVANIFQVFGAIAFGFLFVIIFYRGNSLLPCIITHSAINILSAFAKETGLTLEERIVFSLIQLVIIVIYVVILTRTLPKKEGTAC